ncbi:MAG: hypothetical protein IPG06_24125 [Haliea sp.]|nr:hypothetical protein [Haliea sp.]
MSHSDAKMTVLKSLTLAFACFLLGACSNGSNNNNNEVIIDTGDPDFPGYVVVSLEAGADLETRALEALITAEPNTIIQLPAGVHDFVDGLSSSVDNIVLRGTGMDAESGTVFTL